MNQETEKNINEAIDWLQETGASVQDFAVEQAPLYCREVVAWELWSGAIFSTIGAVALVAGVISFAKFVRWVREDGGEPTVRTTAAFSFAALGIMLGLFTTSAHLPKTIKAAVAPRMVIVEHLRGLKNP